MYVLFSWVEFPLISCFEIKVSYPSDRILYSTISDISVVVRETTFTISDSIEIASPVEYEIARVISLCTTEITEITGF